MLVEAYLENGKEWGAMKIIGVQRAGGCQECAKKPPTSNPDILGEGVVNREQVPAYPYYLVRGST